MRLYLAITTGLLTTLATSVLFAKIQEGSQAPKVVLDGEEGGKVSGGAWNSDELKGKVHVLFYVDPDFSELNDHVTVALKKHGFPPEKFASVAVINMGATWKPNFAINSKLKDKQKEFPRTTYVKDLNKKLVQEWKLADDSSDVVAFNPKGQVVFSRDGKLSEADVALLLKTIETHL